MGRGNDNRVETESVVTIYKNAVRPSEVDSNEKRQSSSSEEQMDTSDEIEKHLDGMNMEAESQGQFKVNHFIVDQQGSQGRDRSRDRSMTPEQPQSSSMQHGGTRLMRAKEMVRDAEVSKARIYDVPDKENDLSSHNRVVYHSSLLDEDYLLVGNYLDDNTRHKIGNAEYVDFAKLVPKDRVANEDNQRMEIVNRGGMTYWLQVGDHEGTVISNYSRWEQAFHVFNNVYTSFHPHRAGELIQYGHVIHTASQSFIWENVYRYDCDFRTHMSRHHMNCSWGVILQQAWSMFLKDKISGGGGRGSGQPGSSGGT